MRKIISFGKVAPIWQNNKNIKLNEITLELELKERDGKPVFTASGNLWDHRHRDIEMGGQCIDHLWEDYQDQIKNKALFKKIMKLWEKYHLNDTNAWCEHMNYGDFPKTEIAIHHLSGNEAYDEISKIRQLPNRYLEVSEQGLRNIPRALYEYPSYKIKKNEHITFKSNGWLTYDPVLTPEGLIGKACPVCGAKYGCSWWYKPIEPKDLEQIRKIIGE
jgi:hypothetical protein